MPKSWYSRATPFLAVAVSPVSDDFVFGVIKAVGLFPNYSVLPDLPGGSCSFATLLMVLWIL